MTNSRQIIMMFLLGGLLLLASCQATQSTRAVETPVDNEVYTPGEELKLVTLLPKDAIPSIDNPQFYGVEEANAEYADDELVLGVNFDGDARAYSTGLLSRHEIVNDVVNDRPIAVTW